MPDVRRCTRCGKQVVKGPKCISCSHKGHKPTPEANEKNRQSQLGRKHSLETRKKISLSKIGKPHRMPEFSTLHKLHLSEAAKKRNYRRGYKLTEEQRQKYVNAGNNKSLEKRAKLSEATKRNWDDPNSELRRKVNLYWENEEHRINKSEIGKRLWKNPEYRDKVTRMAMSHQNFKPNRQETFLNNILTVNFPGEWKYVGDGQLIIAGKCPDFMNINGKKSLIELFGDYWHRGENPEDRVKIFEPYGYSTLVIWEKELSNPEAVVDKIKNTFYAEELCQS